jgi:3'-phosphoadenosine 5'-phosphosulfate sulfotransferase (PAPS reductase)/FAD synthetase
MSAIERAARLAHYDAPAFRRRMDYSMAMISRHHDYAISTSWGKDSVALLHLAAQILTRPIVLNVRYPNPAERFPDMDRVRDAMLARPDMAHVDYQEVSAPGEWEMYERAGGGFAEAVTPQQKEAARWWKRHFEAAIAENLAARGCTGSFLGLRADESRARRMNVLVHGDDYVRADGVAIALPIARWSGDDVWAYITRHNLPSLRIYDEAMCGRERARSGFVFATGGAGAIRRHGVWDDWRRVYPTEFAAWMARFPELDK